VEHNQTILKDSRRVADTYTLPNNYRIKIYTYHDKNKHAYWSVIKECVVRDSGTAGIYFERHRSHVDLNKLLNITRAPRYSYTELITVHNLALQLGAELRDQYLEINADITAGELAAI
jgi:hypothetical protein